MGVPVVTYAGDTLASRNPGSQLRAIGLPDLVTSSLEDYEALALRLASDPRTLAEVRARLARNRSTTPLFDMPAYARDLEDGLSRIWSDYASRARIALAIELLQRGKGSVVVEQRSVALAYAGPTFFRQATS